MPVPLIAGSLSKYGLVDINPSTIFNNIQLFLTLPKILNLSQHKCLISQLK